MIILTSVRGGGGVGGAAVTEVELRQSDMFTLVGIKYTWLMAEKCFSVITHENLICV